MAMIIQCERCQTKFRLDDERVPEKGVKVRCSKCQHTFVIEKPLTPGMEPVEGSKEKECPVETPKGVGDEFGEFLAEPEEDREDALSSEDEEILPRKFPLKLVVLLVLVALVSGGAFLFRDNLEKVNWEIFSISNLRDYLGSSISSDRDTIFSESQTRGYYLDNINTGRIFVIEGEATNNSSEVKNFIKVKGTLFDSVGNKLTEREVYCGNILSKEELMKLGADQIDSFLTNPAGEPSINLDIPPQKSIPFMVVFHNLPEDLKEFSVETTGTGKTAK